VYKIDLLDVLGPSLGLGGEGFLSSDLGLLSGEFLRGDGSGFSFLLGSEGGGLLGEECLSFVDGNSAFGGVVGVDASSGGVVSPHVMLERSSRSGSLLGSEETFDGGRLTDFVDVSVREERSGENVVLLGSSSVSGRSPQGVELLEGILSPHHKSANVSSRGKLQEVQILHVCKVHSFDVSDSSSEGRRSSRMNEKRSSSVNPFAVSGLSFSSSK